MAMFSARWSGFPVPGMARTCGPWWRVQASRIWAGVASWARATASSSSSCTVLAPSGPASPHDRVERYERDALFTADTEHVVGGGVRAAQSVLVLDADHRCDRLGLREVPGFDGGDPEMPDEPGLAQLGQRAEVLGDGVLPHPAQIDDIEMVAAQLPQVLLDMAAQLVGARGRAPLPEYSRCGPTLVTTTRSSG